MLAAARAYQQMSRTGLKGRELEATVLSQCAGELEALSTGDFEDVRPLMRALQRNCEAWQAIAEDATSPNCHLPLDIAKQVAWTAALVFTQTRKVAQDPSRDEILVLALINRNLAAGLRGDPS